MNAPIGHMIASCLAKFDRLSDEDQMLALKTAKTCVGTTIAEERHAAAVLLAEIFDERPQRIREMDLDGEQP